MAEYIEREALKKRFCEWCNEKYEDEPCEPDDCPLRTMILDAPAADVVEVVRCKDCKYRYVPTRCALWYATMNGKEYFVERGEDFYCSCGERKCEDD